MEEYRSKILSIAEKRAKVDELRDKKKGRIHDKAMEQVPKLVRELREVECEKMLAELLLHDSESVRILAGTLNLYLEKNVKQAIRVLEDIVKNCKDPSWRVTARFTVDAYREGTLVIR
jgi:hypothetical protein